MISEIDRVVFLKSIETVSGNNALPSGIGTYKEKTLHRVLKFYFEPDDSFHEVKIGEYVADIKHDNRITEIQTAAFGAIKNRLDFFLRSYEVTVVYPILGKKYLVWVDPESGESSDAVLTPKKGRAIHVLPELGRLGRIFFDNSLSVKCVILEVTEYKMKDGWGNGGKRGAHRIDRVPSALIDIISINDTDDVRRILPYDTGDEFTSKEFAKKCGFSHKSTRDIAMSLKFLQEAEIVDRVSKSGNAYIYRVI